MSTDKQDEQNEVADVDGHIARGYEMARTFKVDDCGLDVDKLLANRASSLHKLGVPVGPRSRKPGRRHHH